ncbi:MAG: methionyl-tRNA formyltransferase [Clostridia bacterium]|nr:methionyl-tRNA formyltransferase [Clostridia bacterium]
MRLAFMGTPEFAVVALKALLEAGEDIIGVVTQPDRPKGRGKQLTPPPVKQVALAAGLEVIQPASLKEKWVMDKLHNWRPEAIVVVAYGRLLPGEVLELPPRGCINLHASLLPRYRGAAPIQRAIMQGEPETGVTTMYVAPALDSGDIILQERVPIGPEDTAGELHDRLAVVGADLLVETLKLIASGRAPRRPQDEAQATYAPPLRPEEEIIDWSREATVVVNHIRGLSPWPGAYTLRAGERLKIYRARLFTGDGCGAPGEVLAVLPEEGFVVQAGAGRVLVTEVQPPGKKPMPASAYLRGYRLKPGEVLG